MRSIVTMRFASLSLIGVLGLLISFCWPATAETADEGMETEVDGVDFEAEMKACEQWYAEQIGDVEPDQICEEDHCSVTVVQPPEPPPRLIRQSLKWGDTNIDPHWTHHSSRTTREPRPYRAVLELVLSDELAGLVDHQEHFKFGRVKLNGRFSGMGYSSPAGKVELVDRIEESDLPLVLGWGKSMILVKLDGDTVVPARPIVNLSVSTTNRDPIRGNSSANVYLQARWRHERVYLGHTDKKLLVSRVPVGVYDLVTGSGVRERCVVVDSSGKTLGGEVIQRVIRFKNVDNENHARLDARVSIRKLDGTLNGTYATLNDSSELQLRLTPGLYEVRPQFAPEDHTLILEVR